MARTATRRSRLPAPSIAPARNARRARWAAAIAAVLLSACAAHHVSPADPGSQLPDRSAPLAAGAERAEVRRVLGPPIQSSAYWRFDLFRATTSQSEVVFAVTPWPVPFARLEDDIHRYTLVAYDARGVATSIASGLFRKPAAWRNTAPIERDFPALHLRAADLMFFVDPEGARDVNLLAAPALRDTFLADARLAPGCTAVLGCADRGCPDQVAVDAGAVRRLPLRTAHVYWMSAATRAPWLEGTEGHDSDSKLPWLEALVAFELPAGAHTFVWSARHLAGTASTALVCRPGEVTWLTIDVKLEETFWHRNLTGWQITQSSVMPQRFARRSLVLIDDGQWYAGTEPAR